VWANLSGADLFGADISEAQFAQTIISDVDLSTSKNLETIRHSGSSTIDHRTLQRSGGRLPLTFPRGVGLPEKLINYLPSLLDQEIQHYSCFISYSSKDDEFVRRLHADLQSNGVRCCWFDAEDMKIGAKIEKAFEEERQRGGVVLFPMRLDDAVLTAKQAWASHPRRGGQGRTWCCGAVGRLPDPRARPGGAPARGGVSEGQTT
jgi:uncharacterized protein YjbI with pentapeptide repeats